jgi:DNA-directed RNA polymerase specialized sigma24 family protein
VEAQAVNTSTSERRDQVGAFFAANATRVHDTVSRSARASEPVIEDACQVAWTILVRRPDVTLDERGLNWLAIVAIREAWRLASIANEIPAGSFQADTPGEDDELPEPAHPDDRSAEQRALDRIEHRERFDAIKTLKPSEREALYLKGLGYSYKEIQAIMGGASYTAVDRRIKEGRAALRQGGRTPRDRERREPSRSEAAGGELDTDDPRS